MWSFYVIVVFVQLSREPTSKACATQVTGALKRSVCLEHLLKQKKAQELSSKIKKLTQILDTVTDNRIRKVHDLVEQSPALVD